MDIQPCGYLPFKVAFEPGDRLILCPAYIFPIEVLERGLMTRMKYLYQTVVVNGYDGRTTLVDCADVVPVMDFCPDHYGTAERLELKVSVMAAPEIAEFGSVPQDCRNSRMIIRNRNVAVNTDKMKLVWHIYAVRGAEVIDTFSGERIKSAGLLGMLFS